MFNPDQFLDMQVTEANDTKLTPIPVGEYTAIADEVKCRQWQSKKDPSMSGLTLDVIWNIDSQELKELLGREKVVARQGIMLELTESGTLDMGKGKNVQLGRLREALDLNQPGVAFSFNQIPGRVAKISVTQRIDGDNIFNDVKGVMKMA